MMMSALATSLPVMRCAPPRRASFELIFAIFMMFQLNDYGLSRISLLTGNFASRASPVAFPRRRGHNYRRLCAAPHRFTLLTVDAAPL